MKEEQFGLRKGKEMMDTVYVINYAINKELRKKKNKIFAFFAALRQHLIM